MPLGSFENRRPADNPHGQSSQIAKLKSSPKEEYSGEVGENACTQFGSDRTHLGSMTAAFAWKRKNALVIGYAAGVDAGMVQIYGLWLMAWYAATVTIDKAK